MTPPNALDALREAVDAGYKEWDEHNCHEPGCGCVTEYIKKYISTVLAQHALASEAALEAAIEAGYQHGLNVHWGWSNSVRPTSELVLAAFAHPSGQPALVDVPLIISLFCYGGAHLKCDTDKRCQCECHKPALAALKAELHAEQRAHEAIASLCFENGASTDDGTSLGAVRGLVALKAEVRREEDLREAAEYAAQALERVEQWVRTSEYGKYFTVSYQGNLQRLRDALAAPPAVTRDSK